MSMLSHKEATIYGRLHPAVFMVLDGLGQTSLLSLHDYLFFGLVKSSDPRQSLLVFFSVKPGPFQFEHMLSGSQYQSAGNEKELVPDVLNRILYLLLVQHFFFKDVHKVVGEHQKLKPGIVPSITMGNHLIQSKTIDALFDEVFTTGPLIVKSPDLIGFLVAIGQDDLIVIDHIVGVKEFELFSRSISFFHPFSDNDHPQGCIFFKDVLTLSRVHTPSDAFPLLQMSNLFLNPWLHRNNQVKLNILLHEISDHLSTEKSAVSPKPDILNMTGQFLDEAFKKLNGIIRAMVFAASKETSQIIPGLSPKAHQVMIALSALLLGIISESGSLLIPINRGHVRIKIKGDAFKCLKALSELHEKLKVELGNLPGNNNLQRTKKTADSRLDRKTNQTGKEMKDPVRVKNLHLPRSWVTQKHCVQTAGQHVSNTIFALSSTLYLYSVFNLFLDSVMFKKSPYKTASTKSGEIFATEFFFDSVINLLALVVFLRYILFHLLSASSVVLGFCLRTHYNNRWRHFF
jgi:hypothetical protein